MNAPEFDNSARYADWQLLGEGGLGATWLARDTVSGQMTVLKVRRDDAAGGSSDGATAQRWAGAARLDSPHLQRFLQVSRTQDGRLIAAHAYVPGPSLRDRIEGGALPYAEALRIIRDVARGLLVLHSTEMVHRDVSPENIILSDAGAVLIDFDAIGVLTEDSAMGRTTVGGDFAGKLRYMSPEQLVAAPQTASVDIWALGAVLYEALTGQQLQAAHQTVLELSRALATPPNIQAAPAAAHALLAALLSPDPAERPSAKEIIDRIDGMLAPPKPMAADPFRDDFFKASSEGGSAADPAPRPSAAPDPIPVPKPPPPPVPVGAPKPTDLPARRKKSGSFGLALFVLLVMLTIGVIAGLWAYGHLSGDAVPPIPPDPTTGLPSTPALPSLWHVALLCGGLLLAISSLFVARFVRERSSQASVALPYRALELINAPDARGQLAETICVRIDAYREMAGRAAEDMLTVTMVALAKEYAEAETADERFRALEMLSELHSKVSESLKPWWLQYESLIARGLSLTTLVAGIVAAIEGVRGLF